MRVYVVTAYKGDSAKFFPYRPAPEVLEVPRGIDPIISIEGFLDQKRCEANGREFYFAYTMIDSMEALLERFHKFYIRSELERCWNFTNRSSTLRRII